MPGLAVAVLLGGAWWIARSRHDAGARVGATLPNAVATPAPTVVAATEEAPPSAGTKKVQDFEKIPDGGPLSLEEQHKEIDRKNMRKLHAAIFEYKNAKGHFPEYLSQLAPEFVEASALHSPRRVKEGGETHLRDHPDPGNTKPSYGFEFSNVVFRDERTFAEIKEVQRAEWGDVVPILRRFGHDKVINMSYGGDLYETALNWEWDPATLDIVARSGWGPGLDDGKFTVVQVLGASGQPLPNAPVWADGRIYSFDLPHRPFVTDAQGFARIPLGADLERTALVLRFEGFGQASPAVAFPRGEPPENHVLQAALARSVLQTEAGMRLDDSVPCAVSAACLISVNPTLRSRTASVP